MAGLADLLVRGRAVAPVLVAYAQTRNRAFDDRGELEAFQAARLRKVLARAAATFPYYRAVAGRQLSDFPVMTKDVWLQHFSDLNTAGASLAECLTAARETESRREFDAATGGLAIGLSTGTSGRQGAFLTSPAERARWAGIMLAKALPSGLRHPARVALFLRSGGALYDTVGGGRIDFRYFDLALPWERLAAELVAFAPTILAAPPAVLGRLADALDTGELTMPPPEIVYSVADVLEPELQARARTALLAPVGQIYQATEGFLGITCAAGTLHLNEDLVVVERDVIDPASGRFVPIVTDLWRTSQAIVRYRLDDILVPSPAPCVCGSVMLAIDRVEGRADDVLLLPPSQTDGIRAEAPAPSPSGATLRPLYADFVRAAILAVPRVVDFRLVQVAPGQGALALRLEDGASGERAFGAASVALDAVCRRAGLQPLPVTPAPWPVETLATKARRVRRDFAA